MGAAAAIAAVVVAGGAASHTADVQHETQGDAESVENKTEFNQNQILAQAQQQQDDQQKTAADLTARAQARNKVLTSGAPGQSSTILTSPLGLTNSGNQTGGVGAGGKTLLGS